MKSRCTDFDSSIFYILLSPTAICIFFFLVKIVKYWNSLEWKLKFWDFWQIFQWLNKRWLLAETKSGLEKIFCYQKASVFTLNCHLGLYFTSELDIYCQSFWGHLMLTMWLFLGYRHWKFLYLLNAKWRYYPNFARGVSKAVIYIESWIIDENLLLLEWDLLMVLSMMVMFINVLLWLSWAVYDSHSPHLILCD